MCIQKQERHLYSWEYQWEVLVPKGYKNRKYSQKNRSALFIVAEKDQYSTEADIPKGKDNMQQLKVYDCEHISGFFKYPVEYTETIVNFLRLQSKS